VTCSICDDTGWKTIEVDGVSRVARCECWTNKAALSRMAAANIPTRYQHCTLENFHAYNESLKRAVKYAYNVASEFPARRSERDQGLLLMGLPGVGKTHLAVAILRECIGKGGTGRFFTMIDLLAALRSTYAGQDGPSESAVLRDVTEADVVVVDELGRERATEWRDEILHLVINARYSNRRPTIFTTNYDVGEIDDPDALQVRVGLRVYSRLQEMCESLLLDAADYRERPTNAGVEDLTAMWKMRKKVSLPSPRGGGRQARAQLKPREHDGRADLKWPGGRAGS
jgi:DNA replication protein DnaC